MSDFFKDRFAILDPLLQEVYNHPDDTDLLKRLSLELLSTMRAIDESWDLIDYTRSTTAQPFLEWHRQNKATIRKIFEKFTNSKMEYNVFQDFIDGERVKISMLQKFASSEEFINRCFDDSDFKKQILEPEKPAKNYKQDGWIKNESKKDIAKRLSCSISTVTRNMKSIWKNEIRKSLQGKGYDIKAGSIPTMKKQVQPAKSK